MTFVVMVIWIGFGANAMLDTERYGTMVECEAAKAAIISALFKGVTEMDKNITCVEVSLL